MGALEEEWIDEHAALLPSEGRRLAESPLHILLDADMTLPALERVNGAPVHNTHTAISSNNLNCASFLGNSYE